MNPLDLDIEPELFEYELAPGEFQSGEPNPECRCVERPCRCGQRSGIASQVFDEYDSEYLTGETDLEELDEDGLSDLESLDFESESEVNRNSQAYIRWVQRSLNHSMGMQLAVDGILGPLTRSAIRRFQQRHGLRADGIVGTNTEARLIATGAGRPPDQSGRTITLPPMVITGLPCSSVDTLNRFDFDSAQLRPAHIAKISTIAERILVSQTSPPAIRTVYVTGHTDPVGTDAYNLNLAKRRALSVRRELMKALEQKRRGLSSRVLILARSRGEREPISNVAAENRRVEVCLSIRALSPSRPPAVRPTPPSSPHRIPTTPIPSRPPTSCNRPELARRVDACINGAKQCLIKAHAKLAAGLARCRMNPFCNARQMGGYYLALRRCREALLACDRKAKQDTRCI